VALYPGVPDRGTARPDEPAVRELWTAPRQAGSENFGQHRAKPAFKRWRRRGRGPRSHLPHGPQAARSEQGTALEPAQVLARIASLERDFSPLEMLATGPLDEDTLAALHFHLAQALPTA
jgi:hypothetical protein